MEGVLVSIMYMARSEGTTARHVSVDGKYAPHGHLTI
jgi:hypothetical protein